MRLVDFNILTIGIISVFLNLILASETTPEADNQFEDKIKNSVQQEIIAETKKLEDKVNKATKEVTAKVTGTQE